MLALLLLLAAAPSRASEFAREGARPVVLPAMGPPRIASLQAPEETVVPEPPQAAAATPEAVPTSAGAETAAPPAAAPAAGIQAAVAHARQTGESPEPALRQAYDNGGERTEADDAVQAPASAPSQDRLGAPTPARPGPPAPPSPTRRLAKAAAALVPVSLSLLNLLVGYLAAKWGARGLILQVGAYIFVADLLSGLAYHSARLLKSGQEAQGQLGRAGAALAFGLAPAFLAYDSALRPLGWAGLALSAGYAGAALWRLASRPEGAPGLGLPAAATAVAAFSFASGILPAGAAALGAATTALATAGLLSRWRYPAFPRTRVGALAVGGIVAAGLLAPVPHLTEAILAIFAASGLYLVSGPLKKLLGRG